MLVVGTDNSMSEFDWQTTNNRLSMHGFTRDHLDTILSQMVETGKDAPSSMGTDTSTAVLSSEPSQFLISSSSYSRRSQTSNRSHTRGIVMTLECPVGPEHNLLETSESHARRLMIKSPILSLDQLAAVRDGEYRGWRSEEIDTTYPHPTTNEGSAKAQFSSGGVKSDVPFTEGSGVLLAGALDRICAQVSKAVDTGEPSILILSDRNAGPDRLPVPSLAGAVHYLLRTRQRCR